MDTIDCPKCEHEHEPVGSHEADSGEMECDECGFKFRVAVQYEPEYYTECVVHELGDPIIVDGSGSEKVLARFCKYCCRCVIQKDEVS